MSDILKTKKQKYFDDAEFRKKSINNSLKYYYKHRDRIRARKAERIEAIKNGENIKRIYNKPPFSINFYEQKEFANIMFNIIMSGKTDTILYKANKDEIIFKHVRRYLPSHEYLIKNNLSQLKKEYKSLISNFTDDNILLIRKEPPEVVYKKRQSQMTKLTSSEDL